MTKEQLEQVIDLRNEIEQLEKEINQIRRTKQQDKVSGSLSGHPYTQASITIQGYNNAPSCETRVKEDKITLKLFKLNTLLDKIDDWIKTIKDSKMRQIITYRYYQGLTWNDVAAKMGYRYSADGCRKACRRFLEKK